jgi:hypothetical protein
MAEVAIAAASFFEKQRYSGSAGPVNRTLPEIGIQTGNRYF